MDYNLVHSQPNRRRRKRETLKESIVKKQRELAYINAMRKDWAQHAIWRKQFSQEYLDNTFKIYYINQNQTIQKHSGKYF